MNRLKEAVARFKETMARFKEKAWDQQPDHVKAAIVGAVALTGNTGLQWLLR